MYSGASCWWCAMRRSSIEVASPPRCACSDRTTGPSCLRRRIPGCKHDTTEWYAVKLSALQLMMPSRLPCHTCIVHTRSAASSLQSLTTDSSQTSTAAQGCFARACAPGVAAQHDAAAPGPQQCQRHQRLRLDGLPRLICTCPSNARVCCCSKDLPVTHTPRIKPS